MLQSFNPFLSEMVQDLVNRLHPSLLIPVLRLPAIHLLAFLDSRPGMEAVAKQKPLHLAIGFSSRKQFHWNLLISFAFPHSQTSKN